MRSSSSTEGTSVTALRTLGTGVPDSITSADEILIFSPARGKEFEIGVPSVPKIDCYEVGGSGKI